MVSSSNDLHQAKNLKQKVISKLAEFSSKSTSHGLPQIVESTLLYQKIFWTICFVGSIGLCSIMIARTLIEYLHYEVTTTIRVMSQEEIVFPQVSICIYDSPFRPAIESDLVLLECSFSYSQCDANYLNVVNTPGGICYFFNSNSSRPLLTVSREGDSLYAIFYVRPYDDFPQNFTNFTNFSYNQTTLSRTNRTLSNKNVGQIPIEIFDKYFTGVEISIDDQKFFPLHKQGIDVSSGNLVKISVNKMHTKMMAYPYSDCYYSDKIDTILSREMKKLDLLYNRRNCLLLCEQKMIIDKIKCFDSRLPPILGAIKPCEDFNAILNLTYNIGDCFDLCPYECETVSFDLSTSYAQFPSNLLYGYLIQQESYRLADLFQVNSSREISHEMLASRTLGVYIYFDKIATTEITESASVTVANLFADIGGHLGLFIGVSLLSFVELFQLLIDIIIICVTGKSL